MISHIITHVQSSIRPFAWNVQCIWLESIYLISSYLLQLEMISMQFEIMNYEKGILYSISLEHAISND